MQLLCPNCQNPLARDHDHLACAKCGKRFSVDDNIPLLYWLDEGNLTLDQITEKVKAFYETNPFPNYEDIDSAEILRYKAEKSVFAKLLDQEIRHNSKVLEAGCGTGQLSNYLGTRWGREVIGVDMCLNSLKLAENFRKQNDIQNVSFVQMNLFFPIFAPASFDMVISNGVLHHTKNPKLAFETIAKLVKPGGYIVIGLYNKLGRMTTHLRRGIFKVFGQGAAFLDYRLRQKNVSDQRKRTWYRDQYENPNEYSHSIDEVLGWFAGSDFSFVSGIPKIDGSGNIKEGEALLTPQPVANKTSHVLAQVALMLKPSNEGGFFIMIGRKN